MSKLGFKPLGRNVFVEVPKVETTTKSGIIKGEALIKEEEDARDGYYEVVGVGDKVEQTIKVGDMILTTSEFPTFMHDGIAVGMLNENWVIGVKK